ncbi:MAG: xylulokinase [Erysipelotrichaceae bacterium]|nr:xylulokinase [Erysipelotrichaceae bacterium]
MNYIGIDLGTSAVKLLLVDEKGKIMKSLSKEYPLSFPAPGWSEQDPADWWKAIKEGLKELIADTDRTKIAGIGCGGQMHGLVILDEKDEVIRPCILWNDGRTDKETRYLNEVIGESTLAEKTANIAFAGFTAPKILWVRENEKENFEKIAKIMLPKDYINYLLTGVFSSDYSDASGTLLLDVEHKCWSKKMMEICSVREDQLPKLYESYEVTGTIKEEIAEEFGLNKDVIVVAGAGDNAAAAIGTNTLKDGACNISLGTSGTIFICSDAFRQNKNNAIHNFAHANGRYHLMGCILSAASCNKWFAENILETKDYQGLQEKIDDEKLGNNEIYFLPYLMGERSPINDTDARGMFIGMDMASDRTDMYLAVLEGVAFAIRDCLEVARDLGIDIEVSKICGGGSRSKLWRRIIANVLGIELAIPASEEGPGYGGAMLAMCANGEYENVEACADALIQIKGYERPDADIAARYEERYKRYKAIYPSVKQLFRQLHQ